MNQKLKSAPRRWYDRRVKASLHRLTAGLARYRLEFSATIKFVLLCGWVLGLSLLLELEFFASNWLRYGFICLLIFLIGAVLLLSIYRDIISMAGRDRSKQ